VTAIIIPESKRPGRAGRLFVELAASDTEVRESQALRYRVFAEELGARLDSAVARLDRDPYDDYCHHLLVRELDPGEVVASTRLLSEPKAVEAGGFYSESELDLTNIRRLGAQGARLLEIGRTCVNPAFRSGAAIAVLWSGLVEYIKLHGFDYLFGCASVELRDNRVAAAVVSTVCASTPRADPSCGSFPGGPSICRPSRTTPSPPPCRRCSRPMCASAHASAAGLASIRILEWRTC